MPSRRRRMMASVRPRLLKTPAEPSPELRISAAAAQTRVVSLAGIRLGSWESARAFKGIVCDDISEFESYMPSHPVSLCGLCSCAACGVTSWLYSFAVGIASTQRESKVRNSSYSSHSSLVQEAALPRPELVPPLDQYCRRLLSNALPDISCSRCALSGRLSTHPSRPEYRRFTIRELSAPPTGPSTGVVGSIRTPRRQHWQL